MGFVSLMHRKVAQNAKPLTSAACRSHFEIYILCLEIKIKTQLKTHNPHYDKFFEVLVKLPEQRKGKPAPAPGLYLFSKPKNAARILAPLCFYFTHTRTQDIDRQSSGLRGEAASFPAAELPQSSAG